MSTNNENAMQIGMVGLGKMGANMVKRLLAGGHHCIGYDVNSANVDAIIGAGADGVSSLTELAAKLPTPRIVWCMVPAGELTEATVKALGELLESGDVIIDGGNSFYKDDVRRSEALADKGIHYVDVGTSGGVWGVERGYCLMIGGPKATVDLLDPIFKTLAPGKGDIEPTPGRSSEPSTVEQGYAHCGPAGSGHFVKMIHNGIEYGMMMAYAEGFDIMRNANSKNLPENLRYDLNLTDIAEVWRRGSVVSSWLLDLTAGALVEDPDLAGYSGYVEDSGEGRWTVQAAIDEAVPAHVLTAALYARFRSRQQNTFSDKMISAMRKKFGGHIEKKLS
ncbi:phosphogluconate dehydrogenase (NAD(+)-dependent, decarboxylating) [Methylomonas rivi]|uniref:Decarboxylating 6-phosphogluconate dehydrogenase n=1 Tax=Methylomonas rivi TaxID=2952226 RepID=A0ABT1U7V3_9GAMM|nr:decarboxylating 6-phosphogluconate dehydrogenase [Methylomonas sp. WSC-6]MCQ8129455.1 decarboxylating 6-phosphogluconate dehydrogenase [Methylomonas sp. WSC-6]